MHNLKSIIENSENVLNEAVKFGEKEINDILSRSDDFNIGIEYEIRPNMDQRVELESELEKRGLMKGVDKILPEHDEMTEVITSKLSLKDAMNHIKGMFKYLSETKIEVPEMAGMHISISTNKYNLDDFNAIKFYLLLNTSYIHKIFPVREHVLDVAFRIKNNIEMVVRSMHEYDEDSFKTNITATKIKDLEKQLKKSLEDKYLTANIRDYNVSNGRVELRFFGGENYHSMFNDIKQQLLRSLFILELAYTDLYQKDYYKELASILQHIGYDDRDSKEEIQKSRDELLDAIRSEDADQIYKVMNYRNLGFPVTETPPKLFKRILGIMLEHATDQRLVFFAQMVNKDIPVIKERVKNDAELAAAYAVSVMDDRFYDAEKLILSDSSAAGRYLNKFFSDKRLPKDLEEYLADSTDVLFTWVRYLFKLNSTGAFKKENFSELPKPNMEAVTRALKLADDSNIKTYIDLKIIDYQNLDDILKVYVSRADNQIEVPTIITLLRDYKNYYDINGAVILDEELRIKMLEKSHNFHSYLGMLSTEEKLVYVDGLISEYAVFMDGDKNKMAERIGSVIEKREDDNLISNPLKPIDKEFIQAFNEKYNTDIK